MLELLIAGVIKLEKQLEKLSRQILDRKIKVLNCPVPELAFVFVL